MAVAGLLVHALPDKILEVESRINTMSGMTTYGIHQDQYLVVVAEAPGKQMEKVVEPIEAMDGVLTLYTTYLTIEDEIDKA
jgi:nitrate reductase NapAB chaperone NapD